MPVVAVEQDRISTCDSCLSPPPLPPVNPFILQRHPSSSSLSTRRTLSSHGRSNWTTCTVHGGWGRIRGNSFSAIRRLNGSHTWTMSAPSARCPPYFLCSTHSGYSHRLCTFSLIPRLINVLLFCNPVSFRQHTGISLSQCRRHTPDGLLSCRCSVSHWSHNVGSSRMH